MGRSRRVVCITVVLSAVLGCGDDGLTTAEDSVEGCTCPIDVQIDNVALCEAPSTAFAPPHLFSSQLGVETREPMCGPWLDPQPVPVDPWSAVRVSSPCSGEGQVCVTVRSGDPRAVSADDCLVTRVCTPFAYSTPGQIFELAPLPAWVVESSECAQRYERERGYMEFSVESAQLGCGIQDGVSHRVGVCLPSCQADPAGEGCELCGNGRPIRF